MITIEFTHRPPNSTELIELGYGVLFKVPRGTTPYIKVYDPSGACDKSGNIVAMSLCTGQLHWFKPSHIVVELEGHLTIATADNP